MRMALCTILIAAGLVGCANEPVDRESKLLTMAAGEAQRIPDSTQRLTRQLNFASQQMQRGRSDTLASIARSFHPAPTNQIGSIAHVPLFIDPTELTPGDNYKQSFSKPVDYQSVFSQSKSQN